MKTNHMNSLERWAMDLPWRGMHQDVFEMPVLKRLAGTFAAGKALEIGCGNGMETGLLAKHFRPASVTAVDMDPAVLDRARRRRFALPVDFLESDLSSLPFENESFDSVFCLGVVHHLAAWRKGLSEITRVLRKGGVLVSEELSVESFRTRAGPIMKIISDHPYAEMFTIDEFRDELRRNGFSIRTGPNIAVLGLTDLFTTVGEKGV